LADRAAASRCVRRAQCAATRSAAVARNFLSELSAAVRTASDLRSADEGWLPAVLVAASQFRVAVHRSGHARSATAGSLFLAGSACELAKDERDLRGEEHRNPNCGARRRLMGYRS